MNNLLCGFYLKLKSCMGNNYEHFKLRHIHKLTKLKKEILDDSYLNDSNLNEIYGILYDLDNYTEDIIDYVDYGLCLFDEMIRKKIILHCLEKIVTKYDVYISPRILRLFLYFRSNNLLDQSEKRKYTKSLLNLENFYPMTMCPQMLNVLCLEDQKLYEKKYVSNFLDDKYELCMYTIEYVLKCSGEDDKSLILMKIFEEIDKIKWITPDYLKLIPDVPNNLQTQFVEKIFEQYFSKLINTSYYNEAENFSMYLRYIPIECRLELSKKFITIYCQKIDNFGGYLGLLRYLDENGDRKKLMLHYLETIKILRKRYYNCDLFKYSVSYLNPCDRFEVIELYLQLLIAVNGCLYDIIGLLDLIPLKDAYCLLDKCIENSLTSDQKEEFEYVTQRIRMNHTFMGRLGRIINRCK